MLIRAVPWPTRPAGFYTLVEFSLGAKQQDRTAKDRVFVPE